jgi:hypothetical protein
MNEKIEKLRVQALRWAGENINRNLYSDYEIHLKEYEKFAELIIEECAEMGDNFDGQPAGNTVRKYLTAGDAIREYFGVKE